MKFDVCIPTKNSVETIYHSIDSIVKVLGNRLNKIIVVDGYSTDGTLEVLDKIKKDVQMEVYLSKERLGKVREFMIKKVTTKWFFFIDSDIVINKKWFKTIISYIDKKTGAIHGFGLPPGIIISKFRKLQLLLKLKVGLSQRGFTSNTLLLKKAVEGIRLPSVNRLEDILIQKEVIKRGYEWKIVPAFCTHIKSERTVIKEALSDLKVMLKNEGIVSFLKI